MGLSVTKFPVPRTFARCSPAKPGKWVQARNFRSRAHRAIVVPSISKTVTPQGHGAGAHNLGATQGGGLLCRSFSRDMVPNSQTAYDSGGQCRAVQAMWRAGDSVPRLLGVSA